MLRPNTAVERTGRKRSAAPWSLRDHSMNNLSFPATSRLDSWISVAFGATLAIACFILAVVSKDWGLILGGLGLAAFIPSRYFAPLPLFQSLGSTSIRSYTGMDALGRILVVVHTPRGKRTRSLDAAKARRLLPRTLGFQDEQCGTWDYDSQTINLNAQVEYPKVFPRMQHSGD